MQFVRHLFTSIRYKKIIHLLYKTLYYTYTTAAVARTTECNHLFIIISPVKVFSYTRNIYHFRFCNNYSFLFRERIKRVHGGRGKTHGRCDIIILKYTDAHVMTVKCAERIKNSMIEELAQRREMCAFVDCTLSAYCSDNPPMHNTKICSCTGVRSKPTKT